jgi:hypothetical protein
MGEKESNDVTFGERFIKAMVAYCSTARPDTEILTVPLRGNKMRLGFKHNRICLGLTLLALQSQPSV